MGWDVDWIDMAQDRDRERAAVNTVMSPLVLWNVGNFLTSWGTVSFSRRTVLHSVNWKNVSYAVCIEQFTCMQSFQTERNTCLHFFYWLVHTVRIQWVALTLSTHSYDASWTDSGVANTLVTSCSDFKRRRTVVMWNCRYVEPLHVSLFCAETLSFVVHDATGCVRACTSLFMSFVICFFFLNFFLHPLSYSIPFSFRLSLISTFIYYLHSSSGSQDGSVDIIIRLRAWRPRNWGSIPGKEIFVHPAPCSMDRVGGWGDFRRGKTTEM
jgi:hypothetical protein